MSDCARVCLFWVMLFVVEVVFNVDIDLKAVLFIGLALLA
jgi:hypothetical protein